MFFSSSFPSSFFSSNSLVNDEGDLVFFLKLGATMGRFSVFSELVHFVRRVLQRWGDLVFFCSLVDDGGDLVFFLNWYTLYAGYCNDGAF
jgi:hypothetical protein